MRNRQALCSSALVRTGRGARRTGLHVPCHRCHALERFIKAGWVPPTFFEWYKYSPREQEQVTRDHQCGATRIHPNVLWTGIQISTLHRDTYFGIDNLPKSWAHSVASRLLRPRKLHWTGQCECQYLRLFLVPRHGYPRDLYQSAISRRARSCFNSRVSRGSLVNATPSGLSAVGV